MSVKELNDKFVEHENELSKKIMDLTAGNKELADQMEAHVKAITDCYSGLLKHYLNTGKKLTKKEKETREEIEKNRQITEENTRKLKELLNS